MKCVLTIAGSDCSGGAGIQADMKTMQANGVYAMSAVTALTAQNTTGVYGIMEASPEFLENQLNCIFEDIFPDAVKIGMVSSARLIEVIADSLVKWKARNIVVDPVMADNGKLYPAFGPDFPAEMAKVCAKADIILPNITEACLLTGMPYRTEYGPDYIRSLMEKLLELGCKTAVLTGVSYQPDQLGVAYLDRNGKEFSYFTRRCPQSFHGTGDLYSSTVLGGLMRGMDLGDALALAADFVVICIEATAASKSARWYGVEFESQIPKLCEMVEERLKKG